ncbi:MAG TPA: glycosyltransferase [Sedimentisphaerales bacterium]|nr:glycosyltransferase [Sedimentisphaerales bacterium]
MQKLKRIFVIADFKDESPESIRVERRRWPKGFIRLGHDVQRFSYRNILTQFNPFSGVHFRRFMPGFVRKRADDILLEQIKVYHPHVVFLGGMKYLNDKTIATMRSVAPDAVFVGRDNDPFPEKNHGRLAIAKQMDIVVASNAGRFLRTYKEAGVPLCAFVPNPCDPDIQRPYEVGEEWKIDIVFTGKAEHRRLGLEAGRDIDRYNLLRRLSKMPNAKMYGCFGNPRVEGIETSYAISGAKIALSINIVNDVRLYHSDRLINCLSCGAFVLAKRVPDTDLLFEDGVHLRYFDDSDDFFELADWYLKHDDERQRIAKAGMEKAHREFNCVKIAQYVLDLVNKGTYEAPWAEIL